MPAPRTPRITQADLDVYATQLAAANAARDQALSAWEQSEQKLCIAKHHSFEILGINRKLFTELNEAEAVIEERDNEILELRGPVTSSGKPLRTPAMERARQLAMAPGNSKSVKV